MDVCQNNLTYFGFESFYNFPVNQNYNKILKHDWLSPAQFEHQ